MMQLQMRDVDMNSDREYDAEESSPGGGTRSGAGSESDASKGEEEAGEGIGAMEKRAAWLLMNLSVRDREWGTNGTPNGGLGDVGLGAAPHIDAVAEPVAVSALGAGVNAGTVVDKGLTLGLCGDALKLEGAPTVKKRRATSL